MPKELASEQRIHVITLDCSDGSGHKVISSFGEGYKQQAKDRLQYLQQNFPNEGVYKLSSTLLFSEKEVG